MGFLSDPVGSSHAGHSTVRLQSVIADVENAMDYQAHDAINATCGGALPDFILKVG